MAHPRSAFGAPPQGGASSGPAKPDPRRPLGGLRRMVAVALLAAAQASAGQVIQDPHYGDTLFHFFQDRYFTSITSLMVSQHFERVPQHAAAQHLEIGRAHL